MVNTAVSGLDGAAVVVQVKLACAVAPVASVTVTVTLPVPAVVGVPEIRPDLPSIASPAGRPCAAALVDTPGGSGAGAAACPRPDGR